MQKSKYSNIFTLRLFQLNPLRYNVFIFHSYYGLIQSPGLDRSKLGRDGVNEESPRQFIVETCGQCQNIVDILFTECVLFVKGYHKFIVITHSSKLVNTWAF